MVRLQRDTRVMAAINESHSTTTPFWLGTTVKLLPSAPGLITASTAGGLDPPQKGLEQIAAASVLNVNGLPTANPAWSSAAIFRRSSGERRKVLSRNPRVMGDAKITSAGTTACWACSEVMCDTRMRSGAAIPWRLQSPQTSVRRCSASLSSTSPSSAGTTSGWSAARVSRASRGSRSKARATSSAAALPRRFVHLEHRFYVPRAQPEKGSVPKTAARTSRSCRLPWRPLRYVATSTLTPASAGTNSVVTPCALSRTVLWRLTSASSRSRPARASASMPPTGLAPEHDTPVGLPTPPDVVAGHQAGRPPRPRRPTPPTDRAARSTRTITPPRPVSR